MTLTLDGFKKRIPSNILMRGRDLYARGAIVDLSQTDEGWSAQVQGTRLYNVDINQEADGSLTTECTCPYEYGDHCKHVVAVLYALEELFPEALSQRAKRPVKKRRTKADRLREAVEAAPREELVSVLLGLAGEYRELTNILLLRLGATGEKKSDYSAIVSEILRSGRDQDGFIDYWGSIHVAQRLKELLSGAAAALSNGQLPRAIATYQAIAERAIDAMGYADDSSGALGGCLQEACEGLGRCLFGLPPDKRSELFDYILRLAADPRFEGFDVRWTLLEIATDAVIGEPERAEVVGVLDGIAERGRGHSKRFAAEHAALLKLRLIRRLDGETAADEFITANVQYYQFRQVLIKQAIGSGDLNRALSLAEAGKEQARKESLSGLVNDFTAQELAIAQLKGDSQRVIRLARQLWLDSWQNDTYHILKQEVPADAWPDFVQSLLAEKTSRSDKNVWLMAREGLWEQLLNLGQQKGLRRVADYAAELERRYPDEMVELYEVEIAGMLKDVSNRGIYADARQILRRMEILGKRERANDLRHSLIARYPQRRAMIEELNRP
jgi:hypothetical protein